MFEGYRQLLKIVCCKKWADKKENYDKVEKILNALENTLDEKPEVAVLLNLLQKLLQRAFSGDDEKLLHLAINAIINLDEILEENKEKSRSRIEDKSEPSVEKEKVPEKQIEEEDKVLSKKYGIPIEKGTIIGFDRALEKNDEKKDKTLSKNYGIHIKKSVVKEVLSKIKKDFSLGDLEEIIVDYYRNVLKSKASDKGLHVYTDSYIRFLTEFGLCSRDDVPERPPPKKSAVIYHITGKDIEVIETIQGLQKLEKPQGKIDRSSLSNKAKYIILWAEKNGTDVVDIDAIHLHKLHPIGENYQIKDIHAGLDELVEKGIATKFSKNRYAIKREMLKKE